MIGEQKLALINVYEEYVKLIDTSIFQETIGFSSNIENNETNLLNFEAEL